MKPWYHLSKHRVVEAHVRLSNLGEGVRIPWKIPWKRLMPFLPSPLLPLPCSANCLLPPNPKKAYHQLMVEEHWLVFFTALV